MDDVKAIITDPKRLNLIGCVFYGDPFHSAKEWSYENEIGKLWGRFMQLAMKKYPDFIQKIAVDPFVSYELHIETDEYAKNKRYYVFVGMESDEVSNIPLEFFIKTLPKTKYLRFTTIGSGDNDARDIISKYTRSKDAPYKQNFPYIMQRYDKNYKGLDDPDSEIGWMIPVSEVNSKDTQEDI